MSLLQKKTMLAQSPESQASHHKKRSSLTTHHPNSRNAVQSNDQNIVSEKPFTAMKDSLTANQKVAASQKSKLTLLLPKQANKRQILSQSEREKGQQKRATKTNFNQRLHNNIIKDEQLVQPSPPSKQSFRIKKMESRSPKKMRDDLIIVNQQEFKIQKEIIDLHRKHKTTIDSAMKKFQIKHRDALALILPKQKEGEEKRHQSVGIETILKHLDHLMKSKQKQVEKLEHKIQENAFYQFMLSNQNQPIPQIQSSEEPEEDPVEQVPPEKPRLQNNIGSYSTAMADIKNKRYGLNMRRTYDVFKDSEDRRDKEQLEQRGKRQVSKQGMGFHRISEQAQKEDAQIHLQEGENKLTLNEKFKDFLLN